MENEKMFEFMEKMYADLKGDINSLKKGQDDLSSRLANVETEVKSHTERLNSFETKLDKNTLLLEKTNTDIKTLAEVQQSFTEQLGRGKDRDGKTLGERLDVIELAVSNTSKTLDQRFDKLSEKIDDLQIDVNTTTSKAVKTENKVIEFERRLDGKMQG